MLLPELLAPAGSLRMAATALDFGATAIYADQPRYSLRVRNNEFGRIENLVAGIEMAHNRSAKFYVVSNISPHNTKFKTYLADMAPASAQTKSLIFSLGEVYRFARISDGAYFLTGSTAERSQMLQSC